MTSADRMDRLANRFGGQHGAQKFSGVFSGDRKLFLSSVIFLKDIILVQMSSN